MKRFFLLAVVALTCWQIAVAQLNTTLLSHVSFGQSTSDVWGWVAPDGTEYALVGNRTGVSIVSLADPENPVIAAFVPGASSTWRDLKTYGNFAYVTNETGGGLAVIDLSYLPDSVSATNWQPFIPGLGTLSSAHNLYIDEKGICYLAGANLNSGGPIFIDVATTPGEPIYIGHGDARYAHDIYTRGDTMYASDIYVGFLSISDVSDKSNPKLLATQNTPFLFTHNAWLSDNSKIVFTTDERANAPVASYDISDLNNIIALDEFRPLSTINQGVIPHNVHVLNDYLIISYYTSGGIIVDASRPGNLIEVGNYDTYQGPNGGFDGSWGAYPFLPSGNILLSDISNGLFVVKPNYVRAAYLEGTVRDSLTQAVLSNVKVEIHSDQLNAATTNGRGEYKTGQVLSGEFEVTFSKNYYESKTLTVTLENGMLTQLDVELNPLPRFNFTGQTLAKADGTPIANAQVFLEGELENYSTSTNEAGQFIVENLPEGSYHIYVGSWGYKQQVVRNVALRSGSVVTLELEVGYEDDFIFDLGWETFSTATSGHWVREDPVGTFYNNVMTNPENDIDNDLGTFAYITGNGGGDAGADDVDNGKVVLTSPVMDLTIYENPVISYRTWFVNTGGDSAPNDSLIIRLSNGTREVILDVITQSRSTWVAPKFFTVKDVIEVTDNMRISFETGDDVERGHIVEAGVDGFKVTGELASGVAVVQPETFGLRAFPNPFGQELTVQLDLPATAKKAQLRLFNMLGQVMEIVPLAPQQHQITLGNTLQQGVYFVQVEVDGTLSQALKVVKNN